jgi:hypothetical protein
LRLPIRLRLPLRLRIQHPLRRPVRHPEAEPDREREPERDRCRQDSVPGSHDRLSTRGRGVSGPGCASRSGWSAVLVHRGDGLGRGGPGVNAAFHQWKGGYRRVHLAANDAARRGRPWSREIAGQEPSR